MKPNPPRPSSASPPLTRPRSRPRRWLIDVAIVAAVVVLLQWWQGRDLPAGPAPAFVAELAGGSHTSLQAVRAQHAGEALALYFWAEWCPICTLQQDSIDALGADWPMFTVAMQSGDASAVAAVLRERGLAWNTAIDSDAQIAARYGVHGVPALIVIGANGDIRASAIGYTTGAGMRLRMWWAKVRG